MQRNFTHFVCNRCNIPNKSYSDRLIKLGLKSLEYRRWEFDLVTLYKIINGEYKVFFNEFFSFSQNGYGLRGNNKKIKCKHDFKNSQWENLFFHRTKIVWNKFSFKTKKI